MTRDASVLDQVRAGAPSAFTVLEVGGGDLPESSSRTRAILIGSLVGSPARSERRGLSGRAGERGREGGCNENSE